MLLDQTEVAVSEMTDEQLEEEKKRLLQLLNEFNEKENKIAKKKTKKGNPDLREYEESLVAEVYEDFNRRREERIMLERQWELNRNFYIGNQYCDINRRGEIISDDKTYYWQNRGVFNHIAPLIESRLARFSRINPTISIRPKTDDDKDVTASGVAEKLVAEVFKNNDISSVVKKVTAWSETCGTAFYKVVWDEQGGEKIGEIDGVDMFEGDVKIIAVSPFEIFPESLTTERIEDQKSIIHARAMNVSEVFDKYGVLVDGEDISVFDLTTSTKKVSEKIKKTVSRKRILFLLFFPQGRLITVAGGKLLQSVSLPYVNGEKGERTYPFIKQDCTGVSGSFFGLSIIERLIPIQRAYNAVKNRKHEFLNRLSMGVMTVEDGSVDVDDLATEGLSPGKVLVYRQGSKAPEMMNDITMPSDFNEEENKLINEFVIVSGVSDVSSSSDNATITSGSALEILVEQDNSRLLVSAEEIRRCYVGIAKQIIRLYSQFMADVKVVKYQDGFDKTRVYYADKSAIASDDAFLESENELLYSDSQRKDVVLRLYNSGLLSDEDGKLRPATKEKVLSLLGYKDLDYRKGLSRLQEEKAQEENEIIRKNGMSVEVVDDDNIHLDEHIRYVLSEYKTLTEQEKQRLYGHIEEHKKRIENKEKIYG